MITTSELTWMRTTEEQAMSSTVVIYTPIYTAGALGNTVQTWVASGTVACDIWPINSSERSSGNQEISQGMFYVSVPYNTSVTVESRLVINSITYEVTFVPLQQSWLTNLRIEARNYNGV